MAKYRLISEKELKELLNAQLRYQALDCWGINKLDFYSDALNSMADLLNDQYEFFGHSDYDIDDVFDYTVEEEIETYPVARIKGE